MAVIAASSIPTRADRIQDRAAQISPAKLLIDVTGAIPWLIGYILQFVWLVLSTLLGAGMVGWSDAARHIDQARATARAAAAAAELRGD